VDAGQSKNDADADASPYLAETTPPPNNIKTPSLVLVDGFITGGSLQLDDVRVCIRDHNAAEGTYITPHAMPNDRVIPLTNYVGLEKGSGIDLGPTLVPSIDIDIFPAATIANDSAWAPNDALSCSKIACTGTTGCLLFTRVSVILTQDVDAVALVDDTSASGVGTRVAPFEDQVFFGKPGEIYGTAVDFSNWNNGDTISAYYGDWQGAAGSGKPVANPIATDGAPTPMLLATSVPSYETLGLRFDAKATTFGQSLDSIAFVASSTVTPPAFYDIRENFVFALVGDPNDTSVNDNGGRNAAFTRKGLHVAAVPYATPRNLN
jgi:hypothetical protein